MRGADYNVYWGAGGVIDSVIDISHNVSCRSTADGSAASWGILNQSAAQRGAGKVRRAPT